MVDADRIRSLLQRLDATIVDLDAEDPVALAGDARGLRAVKYSFVTAIEACVDVALHLIASERWGRPSTNAGALRLLAEHGVIDAGLADRLANAVGFRNVLVHRYTDVDDRRVIAALADLDDLRDFVTAIEARLPRP